ncbi:unnamed protein product [Bemisia tabaci]|uniref:C-type lectin domain-containing protein n=1 Tax=Bemisia tabaci TaxID=7038 RepID=A0A9P0CC06_BEMTA|nr:unnamed protein product [Bemisia tabaci]
MDPRIKSGGKLAFLIAGALAAWGACAGRSDEKLMRCAEITKKPATRFHLVQPCSFSRMVIVGLTRAPSLERCAVFAHRKQGLAINYNQAGNDMASNCLVLDCPEYDTLLSLQPHSSFDYYSLYSRPIPEENTTCIPGVGMVYLHRGKVNYSEAEDLCENKGGRLASVVSESRTNGLSRLVATLGTQNKLTVAYVGLADTKVEGQFISSKNEPLRCFPYRAWAPSEPRHKKSREDCAVIDSRNSWRVVDCKSKHPFLCELTPSGPLQDDVQACYRLADISKINHYLRPK